MVTVHARARLAVVENDGKAGNDDERNEYESLHGDLPRCCWDHPRRREGREPSKRLTVGFHFRKVGGARRSLLANTRLPTNGAPKTLVIAYPQKQIRDCQQNRAPKRRKARIGEKSLGSRPVVEQRIYALPRRASNLLPKTGRFRWRNGILRARVACGGLS